MMKIILIFLVNAAFFYGLRWIYYQYILPAHLSRFPWYCRYEQIEAQIREISCFIDHLEARRQVKDFANDLSIQDTVEYRQCVRRLSNKIKRTYRRFSPKLKAV